MHAFDCTKIDLWWPWTAITHAVSKYMYVLEPSTTVWMMKVDPHCRQQKCRQMTVVSGNISFAQIFARVLWRGCIKRHCCCRQQHFSVFLLAITFETLQIRAALQHKNMESLVCFPLIPKHVTLNGYFTLNSVFTPVWLASQLRKNKSR